MAQNNLENLDSESIESNDRSNLEEIIIEANGILAKSDTHEHPEIRKNTFKAAANDNYLLLDGGDNVNDYQFGLVMQEAATNYGYKFNSQLENDFYVKKYDEGKLTESEFQLYQIFRIADMNGMSHTQVLDHLVNQGQYFDTDKKFTSKDKQRLEDLVNSDLLSHKFTKLGDEFVQDKEIQAHMQRNLNLFISFMDEEARAYAADMNENPNTKVGMVLGNHDNLLYASLIKQHLDNPDQLILIGYDTDLLTVKQKNGEEITIAGDTNCVSPWGYLNEILPPGYLKEIYGQMYSRASNDNIAKTNLTMEELLKMNYHTAWYDSVMEKLNGRGLDVLLTHGPAEVKFGNPYLVDVAVMSTKSNTHIKGHNHYTGQETSPLGVDTYTVAGEQSLILYKDDNGQQVQDWVQVGSNYGDGMQLPLLHSSKFYLDKANAMNVEVDKYLMSQDNANDNDTTSDSKAA